MRSAVRCLRHFQMGREIRTAFQYCNAMFIAVGHMIEVLTGEWLGDFLRKRIWEPLGMTETFFSLEDARRYAASTDNDTSLAVPYGWDAATGQNRPVAHCDGVLGGAGAVISNVLDYAKYVRSVMWQSGPLSQDGYATMLQPRVLCPQMLPQFKRQMLYSLGWMLGTYQDENVLLHPGGLDGMTATMILLPEHKWAVLVFCNAAGPGRETLAWHLVDEKLNVAREERLDLYEL